MYIWIKQLSSLASNLRQNAGDGEQLGHQVGQVAVHEDEEGLDGTDAVGETRGERGHESEEKAEEDAAEPHHPEAGHSQEHVGGFDDGQICQEGEHAVEHLRSGTYGIRRLDVKFL